MQNITTLHHQIIGDFTSHKAIEVKNILSKLVEKGNLHLTVDCLSIREVDVVGINTIAMIYKLLRNDNGSLTILLKRDSHLSKMLHLTKFEIFFMLIYL